MNSTQTADKVSDKKLPVDGVTANTEANESASNDRRLRYKATRKVTLVGIFINSLLALVQLIGGWISHSQALIADGVHTLSDLATDVIVLFAAKMASKDADDEHPYGHGRIETVATVILGMALASVAVGIAMNAFDRILNPEKLMQPTPLALLFAALAIISKEGMYQYTIAAANKYNSAMLKANAWHHRSDAISSILVAIGVAGSVFLEIPWLDAAAAIAVAVMIFYMGARLILDSTMELVDTAVEPEKTREIADFIAAIEGVQQTHMLRTRKMGHNVLADVHIQVNAYLSVSEGHFIAERVMNKLSARYPEMNDITVHIDPEDDETASPSGDLPARRKIMEMIYPGIISSGVGDDIRNILLHYIDGMVEVEIYLSRSHKQDKLAALQEACNACETIRSVTLYQQVYPQPD